MKTYNAVIIDVKKAERNKLKDVIEQFCYTLQMDGAYDSVFDAQTVFVNDLPTIAFITLNKNDNLTTDFLLKFNLKNVKIILVINDESQKLIDLNFNFIDFLLMPIKVHEVIVAVKKAMVPIETDMSNENFLKSRTNTFMTRNDTRNFVALASIDKIEIIKYEEIIFCKADGRYTNFYLKSGLKIMSSRHLGEYELLLNNGQFFRIHKTYMVNLAFVSTIMKKDGAYCILSNGVNLPIARRRLDDFSRYIFLKK